MSRQFQLYLLLGLALLTFENCRTTGPASAQIVDNLPENILVRYGEYLYERENCASCHTQQVAESSTRLVSLDGLGGKYSNEWYYVYFADPSALIFNAQKDDYPHLYEGTLNRSVVQQLAKQQPKRYTKEELDALWGNLMQQSYELANTAVYRAEGEEVLENQEVLALIAYLQQIPESARKRELDSIRSSNLIPSEDVWEGVSVDSNSVIFQIAEGSGDVLQGRRLFKGRCSVCHGAEGGGGIGPNLTDDYWLHGGKTLDIARTVVYGVPQKGMISWKSQLSPEQVGQIVGYVKSIRGTNPQPAKAPQGELDKG